MKKENLSLIYKLLIVVVSAVGLILNFRIAPIHKIIFYFTILSNMGVFLFYLISIILKLTNKLKTNNLYYYIKGMICINIILTMIVFNVFLHDMKLYEGNMLACYFVHILTPLLVVLDYFLFQEKGNLNSKYKYALGWTGTLIIYAGICVIYSSLGGLFLDGSKYPYFFMNVEEYGISGVILRCGVIMALYILFSLACIWLDKKISKINIEKGE